LFVDAKALLLVVTTDFDNVVVIVVVVVVHNTKIDNGKLLDPFDVDKIDGCKRRNYFANAFRNFDIVVVVVKVGKQTEALQMAHYNLKNLLKKNCCFVFCFAYFRSGKRFF
jgi:hypothetical protein